MIIGGGIIGASIAYHLTLEGLKPIVLERQAISGEATGASAGGVRQQHRDASELPLALSSIARWATLAEELDADLDYVRKGGLHLAFDEEGAQYLKQSVKEQRARGLADLSWATFQECHELIPGLEKFHFGGTFCSTDGHANPVATTEAFARAAFRGGAEVRVGAEVTSIRTHGEKVAGVELRTGEVVNSDVVINAAGAWGADISKTVDVTLPVEGRVPQVLGSMPLGRHVLDIVVSIIEPEWGRALSLKQVKNGSFMLGGGWPSRTKKDGSGPEPDPENQRNALALAGSILPELGEVPVERIWFGREAQTPDALPIVDGELGVDGYVVALGFSGHGFAIAPAIGEIVSDFVMNREARYDVGAFKLSRFQR